MRTKKRFISLVIITFVLLLISFSLLSKHAEIMRTKNDNDENGTKNVAIAEILVGSGINYYPITPTTVRASNKLVKLPWTSVFGKGENDSYHFFSAYFDNRVGAPNRPVVIVMGYALNRVKNIALYCVFKYAYGYTVCLKEPLKKRHPSPCFAPNSGAETYHYYCPVKAGEDPPMSVMISNMSTCNPNFTSNEIPVANRDSGKGKTVKKFGVCVGGPVIENANSIQDLVEFISMSKLMGAELITFYINMEQLNASIIQYILHRFSDVRLIEWKHFGTWYPLHYYGQILIISDCMYRSMYETEYLAQIDLDEMIVPIKGNSWFEMLQDMPQRGKHASFVFQNVFFSRKNENSPETLPDCNNFKLSKYFTKTDRHICYPGYNYRIKLMTKPRFVLEASIHYICSVITGYQISLIVPNGLAIVAHYRDPIPDDCIKKKTRVDKSLFKYSNGLNARICSV